MGILANHIFSMLLLTITFICLSLLILSDNKVRYGILSIVFASVFVFSYLNDGNINIVGILIFLIGLLFIGLELIIPGGFVAGLVGICAMVVGVSMIINNLYWAILTVLVAVILTVLFILIFFSQEFSSSKFNKLVLKETNSKSYRLANKKYLDQRGTTITALRPSGKVEINGEYIDAITRGDFIPKGCEVIVSEVKDFKIIVRRI